MVLVAVSVPTRADCTSAVGPMAVSVLVKIVLRNGLVSGRATLELDTADVDVGFDNVHVNALAVFRFVLVERRFRGRASCGEKYVQDPETRCQH